MLNRHPSSHVDCLVKIGENLLNGNFKATILTGESPDAFNDIEQPDRVAPVEMDLPFKRGLCRLPPHSLMIIHIQNGDQYH